MLICDPNGFYEHTNGYKSSDGNVSEISEPIIIEKKFGNENYKITMKKTNVKKRR